MSTPASPSPAPVPPTDVPTNLRRAFFRSLIIPALVLAFFAAAPRWLDYRLHGAVAQSINREPKLSVTEKATRLAAFEKIDFAQVAYACPPGLEKLRADLEKNSGVITTFQRLRWGCWLSLALVVLLVSASGALLQLNRRARRSRDDLIRFYRLGWQIAMAVALVQVFLLLPLLTYGSYELTILLLDRFFPQLLLALVIGGGLALWHGAKILLRAIPLEFEEPMAREVTPEEAPELWQAVRDAAARLQTAPPDRIVIGMQLNFYVTELAVKHTAGRSEGRTLFLSYPLLRQLSVDEVVAIIGHELGHFIGQDTRLTREFYPLRAKAQATMFALAQSWWVSWTSLQFLNFFQWCFESTEQEMSRERELLADHTAAQLTSPKTMGRALVRFNIVHEALQLGFAEALRTQTQNPFEVPLGAYIREKLVPKTEFWAELFERKTPHPLDSHPPLHVRLESLGQTFTQEQAIALATTESESAYAHWLETRAELFAEVIRQRDERVGGMRAQTQVSEATYDSTEGRALLEQHFPAITWQSRSSALTIPVGFLVLIAIGGCAMAVTINDTSGRVIGGLVALASVALSVILLRRHRGTELVLSAEGIAYSAWVRPLRFADVERISALNTYGSLTLTFHFKTAQPFFWKYALLRFDRKTVGLPLSRFVVKQQDAAQTVFRYLTRQTQPPPGP